MKRVFKICAAVFLLSAFQIPSAAQTEPVKSKQAGLSDFLYAFFLKEGFDAERQYLQNTQSKDFPYNVLIPVPDTSDGSGRDKRLIISCPQQDAVTVLLHITDLIRRLQNKETGLDIEFVFTANDYSASGTALSDPANPSSMNAGTYTYITGIEQTQNTAALIVHTGKGEHIFPAFRKKHIELIPGARNEYNRGTVVPQDFFRLLVKACAAADASYSVRDRFFSLYRIGFSKNEPLVSAWFSAEIPAVLLGMTGENIDALCSVIEYFAEEYTQAPPFGNDRRYSVFTLFNRTFFISEFLYILFLSGSAAITLFVFYIFSFIRGAHRYIHREEFFKTWYLIPLILLITAVLTQTGQLIIVKTAPAVIQTPLFVLTVKTAFSFALFSFVFFPLSYYIFKLPLTGFIYGYLLSLSAFLNIFLFASIDLALIPVFIFEYLIIYVSRSMRRLIPLILCSIGMVVPYIPFIYVISRLETDLFAYFISEAPFLFNVFYAALLLPFEIMIIRILIRFKTWKRRGTEAKKSIRQKAFFAVSFFALFFFGLFTVSLVIRSGQPASDSASAEKQGRAVSLAFERTAQFGRSLFTLKLSSNRPVMRYYIEISSSSVLPVFESNYPYDLFLKPSTAVFALDDYPPEPFILNFSAEGIYDTLCTVTALIETDEGIQTERLAYTIAGAH